MRLGIDEFESRAVEVLKKKGARCSHDGQSCVPMYSKDICHALPDCLLERKENTEKNG